MGKPIILTPSEKLLYDELTDSIQRLRVSKCTESAVILREAAPKAYELHESLKMHGYCPKYHSYILKNSTASANDESFFHHIHPIEDLLAFIQNPYANNEQKDYGIGTEFIFPIYVCKLRKYLRYTLIYGETDWMVNSGDSEFYDLFEALDSEGVSYPISTGSFLKGIWNAAAEHTARKDIQQALCAIAEWISLCEKNKPDIKL